MDKQLQNSLILLGLTQKEIKFFLASYKLGPATVNQVAKEAKIKRPTAYLLVPELISKELIEEDHKQYGKKIFAADPKKILRLISAKQRQLRRQEIELEDNLPQLQALYQASEIRPKVKVFEGNSGLLSVWQDILSTKNEILLWTNQETETAFFNKDAHNKFIAERVRKKISVRVLAIKNLLGQNLIKSDHIELRQTKLLPEKVSFSAETYIYDNKIAILDYKKDIIGIIIESEPITNSQRAVFEMTWNLL